LLNGKTGAADAILATAPPAEFRSLIPRYEMLRGYSLARHKSYSQAEELFKSAIFDAHALGDSETEADSLLQFGMFQLGSHQYDAADTAFRRAQDVSETNHLGYQDAVAINDRGLLQIRRERYADAISLLETARDSASGAGAGFIAALALNNLAVCYENLGDLDRALESQKASVARQEQFGLKTLLSYGYSELGTIFLKKGETSAAIPYFQRAFDAVSQDAPVQYAFSAGNLANVLQQTGSLDRAEQINQIAFKFVDPKNSADLATFTATRAAIAEKRGQHNQAVSHYQEVLSLAKDIPSILWQTYADLAAVYAAQGDFQTADASYSKAISVIAANRADQLKSDYKITFLSNLIHFYQDYVALLMRHGDYDRALEIADSSRASVLTEDLAGNSEPSRSTLIAQMRKAARASHSVFLFYWLAPKQSYLWAITGTACKFYPLADQKQIEQDVTSYRALIEEQKRDPLALASPAGTRLFQELIAPAASLIPKDASVVIVPDGVLHNVNFETLLVSTPTPHYWIEDATITVAPSLSILQAGKSATPTRRSLLIMGNPITQGTGYPDLPEAAAEIANIQRQFPAGDSNILTGAQAVVESYFAAKPAKYSTIHFATHVDANAKSPLDSAIILSPQAGGFRLYARDVAGTPLNADLVTISACRSAGARTLSGEGLVGFAWAFFQAHARNVVTSLWDVSDQSTAQLMEKFYRGVRANHAYAQALREAKLQMLHNSNYKRPYYWAPFQLYSRTL
jgi:CHAT domain-containing protein/Tfp pilus assembly protein PilF